MVFGASDAGLMLSLLGWAWTDSFDRAPRGCRASFVGPGRASFGREEASVGVDGAAGCAASSCNDLEIRRFSVSTESEGRGGMACSFSVLPL